jgi:hypothetical protein
VSIDFRIIRIKMGFYLTISKKKKNTYLTLIPYLVLLFSKYILYKILKIVIDFNECILNNPKKLE